MAVKHGNTILRGNLNKKYRFNFINKLICKRKGHNFKHTHIEPDGWGNEWHWKQCERCSYSTFYTKEVREEQK